MAITYRFEGDEHIGASICATLGGAGFDAAANLESAKVVLTYEGMPSALEELYFGDDGLVMNASEGTVFVDLSPATPSLIFDLYQLASVYGCNVVAAPLVVKNPVAVDPFAIPSQLAIVAGGEQGAYDAVAPLLRAIAGQVFYVGTAQQAEAVKASRTLADAAAIVGVVEALSAARVNDPEGDLSQTLDVLEGTGALAPAHEALAQAIVEGDLDGGYTVGLLMAEVASALSALEDQDMIFPQADAGYHLMELLAMVGGAHFNPAGISLVFADEQECEARGLDWSAVSSEEEGEGCCCGHDHDDPDHECCGRHHHHHD